MLNVQYVKVINTLHQILSFSCRLAFIKCRSLSSQIIDTCLLIYFSNRCESCIDRLFSAGPAPCPICQQVLRKNQFMSQIFEDLAVEKEVRIRKRAARV